jgi:hypothetical protein
MIDDGDPYKASLLSRENNALHRRHVHIPKDSLATLECLLSRRSVEAVSKIAGVVGRHEDGVQNRGDEAEQVSVVSGHNVGTV